MLLGDGRGAVSIGGRGLFPVRRGRTLRVLLERERVGLGLLLGLRMRRLAKTLHPIRVILHIHSSSDISSLSPFFRLSTRLRTQARSGGYTTRPLISVQKTTTRHGHDARNDFEERGEKESRGGAEFALDTTHRPLRAFARHSLRPTKSRSPSHPPASCPFIPLPRFRSPPQLSSHARTITDHPPARSACSQVIKSSLRAFRYGLAKRLGAVL